MKKALLNWFWRGESGVPAPYAFTYTPVPVAPTFSDATAITINPVGENIANAELGGKSEITFSAGQSSRISMTYTNGTAAAPIKFKSVNPAAPTIIGDNTYPASASFYGSSAGGSRHIEFYDLLLYENLGGFNWPGNVNDTNASTVYVQNVETHRQQFAGLWVNDGNEYYAKLNSSFFKFFHLNGGVAEGVDGGEGLYLGNTSAASRSIIYESKHDNMYGTGAGREGIQLTSVYDFEVRNSTIRNSGTWGSPAGDGQNRAVQLHASWGKMIDCIIDGSPTVSEWQGTNMVMYNNYFKWDTETGSAFIGAFADNMGGTEAQIDNEPIIFDNCVFKVATTDELFLVFNRKVDIIVRNCIIADNVAGLFDDGRGATPSNSLIDGGGNTFVPYASIPVPEYTIDPDWDLHLSYASSAAMIADQASQTNGRRYYNGTEYYTKVRTTGVIGDYIVTLPPYVISDEYYHSRGMGYRTPIHSLQPTGITLSNIYVAEGESIGNVIGTFGVIGGSGSYTYEVLDNGFRSGDHAAFSVSGSNLTTGIVFDLPTKATYYLRVRATSVSNPMRYVDEIFNMEVVVTPTAPTDIVLSNNIVPDNTLVGTVVGTLSDDGVPTSQWSLVSGTGSTDNASFSISGSSLIIQETADYATQPTYSIRIRSTNPVDTGLTVEEIFTITVQEEIIVTARGTAGNSSTGTTFAFSPASNCTAGAQILIFAVYDNSNTGGTDPYVSIADSHGNTWTAIDDQLFNPGSSVNTGLVGRWFMTSQNIATLTTGSTITFTMSPTTVNKDFAIWEITGGVTFDSSVKETATSTTSTISNSGNALGNLLIAGIGRERNSTFSVDSDAVDGSWSTEQVIGNGGASNTGMKLQTQYKILTGASNQTYDLTFDGATGDMVEFILRFIKI